MDQSPHEPACDQSQPDSRRSATWTRRTEPLPLVRYGLRARTKRFAALPFLAVLGYYAMGIGAFAVMAAGNVPGGGDVSLMAWNAAENTGPIALGIALAAGRWWV